MCSGKPWLPHWVSSAWWRCWWCLHFLCSVWWFLKSSINDTVTFKSCTLYIQIYKAEYSCTFINKYSVHYLIWNICICSHKNVHNYSTKYIINKLVELHVTQLFFLKLGWVGVVWFTCACPSQGVHPVLCGRFVPGTLWMSMC